MNAKHYIIVDIETTGLSKDRHYITEIAAVKFNGKEILERYHTLINPLSPIPRFITGLTGITNEMVADAPTIDEVLPDFLAFIEDHIIVAHNATFDYGFLNHNCICHLENNITNTILCTKKLANRLVPELASKRLETLCQHFNIINEEAHRAMGDVLATVKVFEQFLDILKEKGIHDQEHILKFQHIPAYKIR